MIIERKIYIEYFLLDPKSLEKYEKKMSNKLYPQSSNELETLCSHTSDNEQEFHDSPEEYFMRG